MNERQLQMLSVAAGAITGLVAGLLFLSWVADLGTKLLIVGGLLVILVVRRERRLFSAAAFLTTAGLVGAAGSLALGQDADPANTLAAVGMLLGGLIFAALLFVQHRQAARG